MGELTSDRWTRREFVARASTAGFALSLFPRVLNSWLSDAEPSIVGAARLDVTSPVAPELFSGLRWRMIGPFRGGRVAAATGVPGRLNEFYFGAVNGGVWKTIDGGRVWSPIFDGQSTASIGAIAVAPSDPNIVFVGSGESTLRDSVGYGNGVYKSRDAGKTWTHLGLDETHHIGKIAIDPKNPNNVFVAAIGKLYAANAERGISRSRDGGRSWQQVLGDDNVGAVEVVIDPANSHIIYAGLWNTRRPPWFTYAPTNGPGGGIFKSTDGGSTWNNLTNGLPKEGIGRTGIAISPTNPSRVYAIVDCLVPEAPAQTEPPLGAPVPTPAPAGARPSSPPPGQRGFFRSDDAGATWTRLSNDPALWGRGWYFEKIVVDPTDPDTVYVPNVAVNRTMDGGKTWVVLRGSPGGDDYHQAWISSTDPNTMIVASDQGAVITRNARSRDPREVTWTSWLNQPTAQIYHLSVDGRFPYWVTGAQQDSGATAAAAIDRNGKRGVVYTLAPSPLRAGLVWVGTDDGLIHLTSNDGQAWQDVSPSAITPWSRVTMIEASHFDVNTAYASVDRH